MFPLAPERLRVRRASVPAAIAAIALALVAWLGGGAPWSPADALAAGLSIVVVATCAYAAWRGAWPTWGSFEWCMLGGFAVVAAWHCLPLPPQAWLALPGRQGLAGDLAAAGVTPRWHALSMDPDATLRALLGGLPALALALVSRGAPPAWRLAGAIALVAIACVSAVLGLAQVVAGAWRPYAFHNLTGANGVFAYRNAHADFLLLALPLALAGLVAPAGRTVLRVASGVALACLLPALAATYSRAAWLLAPLALLGGIALALSLRTGVRPIAWGRALAIAALLTLVAALALRAGAAGRVERAGESLLDPSRASLYADVAAAARDYWPAGAGLGAFEQAFAASPRNAALVGAYYHQAHNDWLQVAFESGLAGVLLLLAALAAYARATWRAWRGAADQAGVLARAASLSLALVMLHAAFDYGLHSGANLAAVGLLAGLLAAGGWRRGVAARTGGERLRHGD
jgi:O-antigen ligase